MQTSNPVTSTADRHSEIAELIRNAYDDLRRSLRSPYVDGPEIYRTLLSLGHDLSDDGPEVVSETLGWKCMRLPVANIGGKPKHYLPLAVPSRKLDFGGISEQVAAYVGMIEEFARGDCCATSAALEL
jgi:hypothetical protein